MYCESLWLTKTEGGKRRRVPKWPLFFPSISCFAWKAKKRKEYFCSRSGSASGEGTDKLLLLSYVITRPDSKWRGIHVAQPMQKSFPEIWSKVYLPSFRMIWEGSLHTVTPPPHPQGMSHEPLVSNLGIYWIANISGSRGPILLNFWCKNIYIEFASCW